VAPTAGPTETPTAVVVAPSWYIVPSPSPSVDNELAGVECSAANDCWAVGTYNPDNATGAKTLTEHWNGTAWTVVSAPDTQRGGDGLNAVACPSVNDCWAVGGGEGYGSDTLIEHWDGSTWKAVASPNTSNGGQLAAIQCPTAWDCWSVGWHASTGARDGGTPIEHWDGSTWTIAASPGQNPGAPSASVGFDALDGIACTSTSNCWAGGDIDTTNGTHSLMEQWDGTAWRIAITANPGTYNDSFTDVTCVSSSDCWAVGGGTGVQSGFFQRWNGVAWVVVPGPSTPGSLAAFSTVRCLTADSCLAVGTSIVTGTTPTVIAAAAWNGQTWTSEAIPSPVLPTPTESQSSDAPSISQLTCLPPAFCVAVGSVADGSTGNHSLVVTLS
jgi:hypothetical protein